MGINRQVFQALLAENLYRPIKGNILLLGRSTVTIGKTGIDSLAVSYGREAPVFTRRSLHTKHSSPVYYVDDVELFNWISPEIANIDIMDISVYEGANLVHDLNRPISKEYESKYDFIFDSSVLDNIFSPSQGILNIHQMLREGGRYVGLNVSTFYPGAFSALPPEWFYSFFAANGYRDVKVYLSVQRVPGENRFEYETDLYRYQPDYTTRGHFDHFTAVSCNPSVAYSIVIAERGEAEDHCHSRAINLPVNLQYVKSSNAFDWSGCEKKFSLSRRPVLGELVPLPKRLETYPDFYDTDHYIYLGSGF